MFSSAKRTWSVIGGAAGVTLVLGVGVGAASGMLGDKPETPSAAAAVLPAAPVEAAPVVVPEETTTAPTTTVAPAPATTVAKRAKAAPATTAAAVEEAPAPAPAPAPDPQPQIISLPARANPSTAQVMQAVSVIQQGIPFFTLTEAQARDFGNQVCTAFDQGQSFAQVKAGVQSVLSGVPLVSVSASQVDYAVRNAVQLFCPGHASKLV